MKRPASPEGSWRRRQQKSLVKLARLNLQIRGARRVSAMRREGARVRFLAGDCCGRISDGLQTAHETSKLGAGSPRGPGGSISSDRHRALTLTVGCDADRPDRPQDRPAAPGAAVPDQLEPQDRTSTTSSSASRPTAWSAGASAPARPTPITAPRRPRPAGTSSRTSWPRRSSARMVDHRRTGRLLSAGQGEPLRQGGPGDGLLGCAGPRAGDSRCMRCSAARGRRSSRASAWGSRREVEAPVRPDRPVSRRRLSPDQAQDRAGLGRRRRPAGPRALSRRSPLQVDANSAYTLDDLPTLKALDDFDLLLIEQPLAHDDIIDHARLQAALRTPICLDESIHSADDARKALDLGACRVINIKVSRLGGLLEAKRVHDVCQAAASRSGAAGCTSSASAGRPTWRSRRCRASRCPATSRARTSIMPRTSSSRRPGRRRGHRDVRAARPGRRAGPRPHRGDAHFAGSHSSR